MTTSSSTLTWRVENRAHSDLTLWPDVKDPAREHPNSPRMVQIIETYKRLYKETGKEQPFVKLARYVAVMTRECNTG